jgi:hypothetical protein
MGISDELLVMISYLLYDNSELNIDILYNLGIVSINSFIFISMILDCCIKFMIKNFSLNIKIHLN